jgi:hypothetical protein
MIPHRMLNTELCGTGIRHRVTACRKRLRVNRGLHKPHVSDPPQDAFVKANICTESRDFTAHYPAMRESSVHSDQAPKIQTENGVGSLTVVVEEVGIT